MKLKSVAMLALVMSLASIPAFADDMTNPGGGDNGVQSMPAPDNNNMPMGTPMQPAPPADNNSDNGMQQQPMPAPDSGSQPTPPNDGMQNIGSDNGSMNSSPSAPDEGSPDTATGDDDY